MVTGRMLCMRTAIHWSTQDTPHTVEHRLGALSARPDVSKAQQTTRILRRPIHLSSPRKSDLADEKRCLQPPSL